jgi:hypothetical protein
VLASDALQYHESNLAPTARYEELASLNSRFAGRGPALFTDFDEYALYELRDLDVGGADFAYPPPALAGAAGGYGRPVVLDRVAPSAFAAHPLIVTRRDPTAVRPPAAYRLLWRGVYYEVWGRRPGAKPALAHMALSGPPLSQCSQVARVAAVGRSRNAGVAAAGRSHDTLLVAAVAPELVTVPVPRSRFDRPAGWRRARAGILMRRPGSLHVAFQLPHGGVWEMWLKGEVMRELRLAIDGRALGSLGAQLGGNSLVANTLAPLHAKLAAGRHTLTIARSGADLAPGDGGAALLSAIYLTPAGPTGQPVLRAVPARRWRSLCGRPLQWVEFVSKR